MLRKITDGRWFLTGCAGTFDDLMSAIARVAADGKPSLVEGNRLRCPQCEELGDLFRDFKPLERNEKYREELNMVYRHTRCGHVFSPGDPWIIAAYLAGDLVPRSLLEEAKRKLAEGGVRAA